MQFRRIPGMSLPMPLVPGTEAMLTPPAAEPVDDETGGDLYDADDADCAAEGLSCEAWHAQYEGTEAVDDATDAMRDDVFEAHEDAAITWRVATILRVRRLESKVTRLESALNDVNNYAQVLTFRLEALERAQKRQAEEQARTLAMEVRALDAAREVA